MDTLNCWWFDVDLYNILMLTRCFWGPKGTPHPLRCYPVLRVCHCNPNKVGLKENVCTFPFRPLNLVENPAIGNPTSRFPKSWGYPFNIQSLDHNLVLKQPWFWLSPIWKSPRIRQIWHSGGEAFQHGIHIPTWMVESDNTTVEHIPQHHKSNHHQIRMIYLILCTWQDIIIT